jgi:glutamate decarboxylase
LLLVGQPLGFVPTLDLTYTLIYGPVEEVFKALEELERKQGLDIPFDVNGASGGFNAPFIHHCWSCGTFGFPL